MYIFINRLHQLDLLRLRPRSQEAGRYTPKRVGPPPTRLDTLPRVSDTHPRVLATHRTVMYTLTSVLDTFTRVSEPPSREVISYIHSIFSAFDREVKKLVDTPSPSLLLSSLDLSDTTIYEPQIRARGYTPKRVGPRPAPIMLETLPRVSYTLLRVLDTRPTVLDTLANVLDTPIGVLHPPSVELIGYMKWIVYVLDCEVQKQAISSDTMYHLNDFRNTTPPPDRQLIVFY